MPNESKQPTRKPAGWSAVRPHLAAMDKPGLLALVKELYDFAAVNRDFVQARCRPGESGGQVLGKYRAKIVEQFFTQRGFGKLKLGEARKAIRDYRKATGDLAGTLELMMTYVENGVRFTCEYGDIDGRLYDIMESVLEELAALLRDKAKHLYPDFSGRLARIVDATDGIGWGFHDYITLVAGELEAELGDP